MEEIKQLVLTADETAKYDNLLCAFLKKREHVKLPFLFFSFI
jgi:hypothetical protein